MATSKFEAKRDYVCQSKILAIHIDNETIFLTTILILNVIAITTTIIILTRRAMMVSNYQSHRRDGRGNLYLLCRNPLLVRIAPL